MLDNSRSMIASRSLAVIALTLWLLSLTQPAFIIEDGTVKPLIWSGLYVLGMGWLGGVLLFTAGWYANLPFFFATFSLLSTRKLPWRAAILGLLLAIDTFRLDGFPGGGRLDVYGYGLGVALWIAAFGCLTLAVAWRSAEQSDRGSFFLAVRTPAVFSVLAILVASTTLYGVFAHRAMDHSNLTESAYLSPGSIKRGELCIEVVLTPATQITLDAPLEVRGRAYPLDSPMTLLSWGIPVVRKGGYDFALADPKDIDTVYWKPAVGMPAAVLDLSTQNNGDAIEANLTSRDGGVTIFHQTWRRDIRKTALFCPDYRLNDSGISSPPRSLLTAALNAPGGLTPTKNSTAEIAITVAPFRSETLPRAITREVTTAASATAPEVNAGCPPHIGFAEGAPGAIELGTYGGQQTFVIGERSYFVTNNQPLSATCAGDNAYLYYFWLDNNRKQYLLYIQRRRLNDFRKEWSLVTRFDYARSQPFEGKLSMKIRSLKEVAGTVTLDIADVELSRDVNISFSVPVQ